MTANNKKICFKPEWQETFNWAASYTKTVFWLMVLFASVGHIDALVSAKSFLRYVEVDCFFISVCGLQMCFYYFTFIWVIFWNNESAPASSSLMKLSLLGWSSSFYIRWFSISLNQQVFSLKYIVEVISFLSYIDKCLWLNASLQKGQERVEAITTEVW